MLTIYVSPYNIELITTDGVKTLVRSTFVCGEKGGFVNLQDWEPQSDLKDVEIILVKKFYNKKLNLSKDILQAIIKFLQNYHAKQNISFDCYAFANMVKGVPSHKVHSMPKYWNTKPIPWRMQIGSVVFLESGENYFHHAAIYIGSSLYISVWGAGGDLEIATLKSMKSSLGAERVVFAEPK